jgi:mitochondrial import inner membrane translocase subunit TIM50
MLSRALPALRLRPAQIALRTPVFVNSPRFYAKVGKPPSEPSPFQQRSQNTRQPPRSTQPSAENVPTGEDNVTAKASLDSSNSNSTFSDDVEETSQPQQPLPDLTKGIPSTLAAELNQARSHQKSHRASLNITEDPAEPVPGEEEGPPRERGPRPEYVSSSDKKKDAAFKYTYLFLGLSGLAYMLYLGRNWEDEELAQKHAETAPNGLSPMHFYHRIRARMGSTVSYYKDPVTAKLLPDEEKDPNFRMPFTLVLSLEDLLIHSEWSRTHGWRIAKRPGVDYFLRYLTQYYELVLFTSQPSATADQVLRKLDPYMMIRWPLFREATVYEDNGYIKVSFPRFVVLDESC